MLGSIDKIDTRAGVRLMTGVTGLYTATHAARLTYLLPNVAEGHGAVTAVAEQNPAAVRGKQGEGGRG